jgi:hypothetical protein
MFFRECRKQGKLLICLLILVLCVQEGAGGEIRATQGGEEQAGNQTGQTLNETVKAELISLPLSFIPNAGQSDPQVEFMVKGSGTSFSFTKDSLLFSLQKPGNITNESPQVITQTFTGSNDSVIISGDDLLPGTANFFIGENPDNWRSNLSTFGSVRYHDLYPGIDLVYRGNGSVLKREFIVAPGVDPVLIRMKYSGADSMIVEPSGDLNITAGPGSLSESRPFCYQEINGNRKEVGVRYIFSAGNELTFQVNAYDPFYELVIDPALVYSTYLGGSGADYGRGIAVDGSGSVYVTGMTSGSFPTTSGAFDTIFGGVSVWDAYVTKLDSAGTSLAYSTYLGGSGDDSGYRIAVDTGGNAYVAGNTGSSNFPTTTDVYQATYGGGTNDAFVTKLNSAGTSLEYSTYLGGSGEDEGRCIAVDGSGNAYVTGQTTGSFPTTTGAYQTTYGGSGDAFVTKLNSAGTSLVYSTYLGGSKEDEGRGIAIDGRGYAYVVGRTSGSFPIVGGLNPYRGGLYDGFMADLNSSGSSLVFSDYRGWDGSDSLEDVTVDGSGNFYMTGFSTGPSMWVTVWKYGPDFSSLFYHETIEGSGSECGLDISVDGNGNAYVTGYTDSTDFPTTADAYQTAYGGGTSDAFVMKVDSAGNTNYLTYLGGSGVDQGSGIAVDSGGNAFITGYTASSNFPTTAGAYQAGYGNSGDAFITKFSLPNPVTTDRIGSYLDGFWYIDQDNSGTWTSGDVTSGPFGAAGARPVVISNHFAVFKDGYWYIDSNCNGFWDSSDTTAGPFGAASGAIPLIINGHKSAFLNGYWYIDQDDSGTWTSGDVISGPFGAAVGATPLIINNRLAVFLNGYWYIDQDNTGTWTSGDVISGPFGTIAGSVPFLVDGHLAVFLNGYWYVDGDNTGTWSGGDTSFGPFGGAAGSTPFVIHQATGSTSIRSADEVQSVTKPSVRTPSVNTPASVPRVDIPRRQQMSPELAGPAPQTGAKNPLDVKTVVQPEVKQPPLIP